jgi:phosphohistidine phosphatase
MKTVLLLRHAKSDWDADYRGDHERPLAKRGVKAAKRMGRFLAETGPLPDRCVTSTAVRARTTLALAAEAGGWKAAVEETDRLYHADAEEVGAVIAETDGAVNVLMLVGHEPTWSETVEDLVGSGAVQMPTAALACIDFDVDAWSEVEWGAGRLRWLVTPRALKA